ncbi:nucleotide-diphospho-sugar transferase [Synechococcus sp. A18-40]|nr:nucleotide-diphospho-sugar transferase [Synechococcus sp. A18-40]
MAITSSFIPPPLVSIGLPVYNGEGTIRQVLDSLLVQSFPDFELIISDNASMDDTRTICLEYASRDSRIKYFRQENNIGAMPNFKYVLDISVGRYFMWAASDDFRSPDFLELNVTALESRASLSASMSPNCYESQKHDPGKYIKFSLSGSFSDRLIIFLENAWYSHGIFYSLMRSEYIKSYKGIANQVIASDWLLNVFMLSKGEIYRTSDGLLVLGEHGASRSGNPWRYFRSRWYEIFFPLSSFTFYTLSFFGSVKINRFFSAMYSLVKLNFYATRSSLKHYFKEFVSIKLKSF